MLESLVGQNVACELVVVGQDVQSRGEAAGSTESIEIRRNWVVAGWRGDT